MKSAKIPTELPAIVTAEQINAHGEMTIKPYEESVALLGPDAPKIEQIADLIRYLVTVQHRFGNTAVQYRVRWGASALWAMSDAMKLDARLPHTADHVPVICDGMSVFCPKGHENKLTHSTHHVYCTKDECWSDGCQGDSGSGTSYEFDECTSYKTDSSP